jgi:hypothetical protein
MPTLTIRIALICREYDTLSRSIVRKIFVSIRHATDNTSQVETILKRELKQREMHEVRHFSRERLHFKG